MEKNECLRQATKYAPIATFCAKDGLTGIYRLNNNIVRTFLVSEVEAMRRTMLKERMEEAENQ